MLLCVKVTLKIVESIKITIAMRIEIIVAKFETPNRFFSVHISQTYKLYISADNVVIIPIMQVS